MRNRRQFRKHVLMPEIPDGMLDAHGAARYLDIDVAEFLKEVQIGHLPQALNNTQPFRKNALGKWVPQRLWSEISLANAAVGWRLRGQKLLSPPVPKSDPRVPKLQAVANDPKATAAERENALRRIEEITHR